MDNPQVVWFRTIRKMLYYWTHRWGGPQFSFRQESQALEELERLESQRSQ